MNQHAVRSLLSLFAVLGLGIAACTSLPAISTCAAAPAISGRSFQRDVFGLRIGMDRVEVHRRLQKMATLEREERGRQEIWRLTREPQFASILVGFDTDFRVRFVTAIAREGGRRMRYSDLAPIGDARPENANGAYTRYTWEFKPDKNRTGFFLIAEGRDPEYLKSFSIKRHN